MRPFRQRLADIEKNPEDWEVVSLHTEKATRKGGRKSGVSVQKVYQNRQSGETIVRHTVTDNSGRVVDDHYRPHYQPRIDEV